MTIDPKMSPGETAIQTSYYATPDHLRVGLYIHIDLPWFRHPFTLSSFKISSEEQIRELRALNVRQFRYDPQRSETTPGDTTGAADTGSASSIVAAEHGPAAAEVPVPDTADSNPAASDPRILQQHEYRKSVHRTEKSFMKALKVVRRLDRNILSKPSETLEEMGGFITQMATVFFEQSEVTLQVMGENCGGEEVHHHGLNVSILCMMLIKGLGLTSEQAGLLGVGAMLHDIGLTEIPDRISKKRSDEQTKPERELRARHVEFGVKIGKQLGLAPEVLSIIEQHHEFADGSGYPKGFLGEQMTQLARIVSLINFYENLCNPFDFTQAMTPHEALSFIFAKRKSQFDGLMLQLLIRTLGVYPPGSLVRLSNEAIAMVVSVNPNKALRPWVMLYDADVPKENAGLLNLETEIDVNISAAIRPAMLPAQIFAYLSPRKRITYFFDGGNSCGTGRE